MSFVQTPLIDDLDDAESPFINGAKPSLQMTEEEFVAWADEDTRAEWVDGEVILMAPASNDHDEVGGWLQALLRIFVARRDLGKIRGPELMIRLANQRRRRVPDLLFISKDRLNLLGSNHFEGAPDLCMEIVSRDSQSRDRREKFSEYESAGVREYWIVDPLSKTLEAYRLIDAKFIPMLAEADGRILSVTLPGLFLKPAWLFGATAPDVIGILREFGIEP